MAGPWTAVPRGPALRLAAAQAPSPETQGSQVKKAGRGGAVPSPARPRESNAQPGTRAATRARLSRAPCHPDGGVVRGRRRSSEGRCRTWCCGASRTATRCIGWLSSGLLAACAAVPEEQRSVARRAAQGVLEARLASTADFRAGEEGGLERREGSLQKPTTFLGKRLATASPFERVLNGLPHLAAGHMNSLPRLAAGHMNSLPRIKVGPPKRLATHLSTGFLQCLA